MKREFVTLCVPHYRCCTFLGCNKRIPVNDWFCHKHSVDGPKQAKERLQALRQRAMFERWAAAEGYCFIYAVGHADRVKFGKTTNLSGRFSGLQSCSPVKLELISAILSKADLETLLHTYLRADRSHGEWFTRSPDVDHVLELFECDDDEPLRELIRQRA